jgi:molybdenum ABC transporter molybdate-binding protein
MRPPQAAKISPAFAMFLASIAAIVVLAAILTKKPSTPAGAPAAAKVAEPLLVFCAAGLKPPVENIAREFEQAEGVKIQLQFGGSQTLLANLEVSQRGDLFIAAEDFYTQLAREKNLVREIIPIAQMRPTLAVRQGNPKKISSLADLLKPDTRLAQANPDAAAVGKLVRDALQKSSEWEPLRARTAVFKPTVNDVANDLKLGSADAGFVWDATVRQYPELESVGIPAFSNLVAHVSAGIVRASRQPTAALRFARFMAARDRGQKEFERQGFTGVAGDPWARTPEIRLLAGAMLRPAIERTITDFEQREGVRVTRVYNGCGILVAQMRAGDRPDAYFACDQSFMKEVNDLFLDAADISGNQLVILVHKGNPRAIHGLKDLAQSDLKLGVGHEKQCALGVLTGQTLDFTGLRAAVMKNVTVQSPTGDLLVNQLRTKSLDAVIAYISNAAGAGADLEAIAVDLPCALATQPVAVGRESQFKQLTARLLESLRGAESKDRFEKLGFTWKGRAP